MIQTNKERRAVATTRVTALCALVLGSLLLAEWVLAAEATLTMPPPRGRCGLEVIVSVRASDIASAHVTAAEFVLHYNGDHLTPTGVVQADALAKEWMAASRDFGGAHKVALASAAPAVGAGALVHGRFVIGLGAPNTIALSISAAYLNADSTAVPMSSYHR